MKCRGHGICGLALTLGLLLVPVAVAAATGDRVTILYDAFGRTPGFQKDWGFAALVEYGGKRILFDTGNDPRTFAENVQAAGVDLGRLDFVVISHRHLDHTAGISHLLTANPGVKIYVPREPFGVFGGSLPGTFYRRDESLDSHERYFEGRQPEALVSGSPWAGANFAYVDKTVEVAPGMHILALISDTPGTREMRELSLAVRTPRGLALVVGCSHPGIERIVEAARAIDPSVYIAFGGFHMPAAPDAEIARVASVLHDTFQVERLAPGHCTGEPTFAHFKRRWGANYTHAGVGSVIELP
jgi:7,8-dihydropterin-6-yl-methyl-4-(beta-D-ribofuranosyl)aminobenzene 5'-phosphate synthase